MTDLDLAKYIYIEYTVAVLLFSELAKILLKKMNIKWIQFIAVEEPKWLTLIVAVIFSLADWIFVSKGGHFNFYQTAISFGLAVLGYDYGLKIVKDLFTRVRDAFSKGQN